MGEIFNLDDMIKKEMKGFKKDENSSAKPSEYLREYVNAFENEFCQNGRYIQAVFWKLSKDMVTDIRYFTAR